MIKPLSNKTALITGGARGIGRATALKLASAGADIIINYYNSSDSAQAVCAECEALGVKAHALQANVADPKSVQELFGEIREFTPHLDFIISNAASGVLRPALEMKLKHWRWCMETNAFALNSVVSEAKDMLRPQGRVIALSSLGASRAIPEYAFIGASKAALEALVRSLSIELAPLGVTANTVSAGVIDTDALKHFPNREQLLEEFASHALSDRALTPEDVANTIYLLCLPEADMIRGQTITVDAGYSIVG